MTDPANKKQDEKEEKPISEMGGAGTSFYRGFGRPDNMKVNLAGEHEEFDFQEKALPAEKKEPEPKLAPFFPKDELTAMPEKKVTPDPEKIFPAQVPAQSSPPLNENTGPSEELKSTIAELNLKEAAKPTVTAPPPLEPVKIKEPVNKKRFFVILGAGILVAIAVSAGSFFGLSYYYNGKIDSRQSKLDEINNEKNSLNSEPTPLEPAAPVVQPENTAPTPAPTPVPVQPEPIEEEKPVAPETGNG